MINRYLRWRHNRSHGAYSALQHPRCPDCLVNRIDDYIWQLTDVTQNRKRLMETIEGLRVQNDHQKGQLRNMCQDCVNATTPPKPAPSPRYTGVGEYYWHIHHEVLIEKATEPIQNRVDFIKTRKVKSEQATRLHLMHRAWVSPDLQEAIAKLGTNNSLVKNELEALHKAQCFTDCPWNGKTIFP